MNTLPTYFIFIFCFSLFNPRLSKANTEAGFCQGCYSNKQMPAKIVTPSKKGQEFYQDDNSWVSIETPKAIKATQLNAGYEKGCSITSLLYTLKLGPLDYQESYRAIPGKNDIEKIDFLASKFEKINSKQDSNRPAFSKKYGAHPYDLPWMFQLLVKDAVPIKIVGFAKALSSLKNDKDLFTNFIEKSTNSLKIGKPIIADLLYLNPDLSHAVVIVGIQSKPSPDGSVKVQILDPLSGKKSFSKISPSIQTIGETDFLVLSFSNPTIAARSGLLKSIAL